MGAVEDYLERCADILIKPENEEVSEVHLEVLARGGSHIFQFSDTAENKDHFVASRQRWLESQGKKATKQDSWQNERHDIKYQGVMAKAPPCPERTLKTPMPQLPGTWKDSGSLRKTGAGGVSLSRRRPREC